MLPLELRFQIFSDLFYLPQNQENMLPLGLHPNLGDSAKPPLLAGFVDNTDMLSTIIGWLRIMNKSDGQDVGQRIWKAHSFKLRAPICMTCSAD